MVDAATPVAPDAREAAAVVTDAGPPESDAGFFGASRCGNNQFLFCEDFEADAINDKRWFYNPGNGGNASGYSAIDKTKAARGSHSLHMHTEVNTKGSGSQVKARIRSRSSATGSICARSCTGGSPSPTTT